VSRLWEYDEFGEPWLENGRLASNPPVLIINPKKGKKTMAAKRKRGRKAAPRRRAVAKRSASGKHTKWGKVKSHKRRVNPWPLGGAVVAVNPRRRRASGRKRSNPRRRKSYRRNPALMGLSFPPLQTVLYTGAGFIGTPMVEGFITKFLPTNVTSTTVGRYAVKIASMLGLSMLTKMVLGSSEAKLVAVGGGVYVLSNALVEFAPGTFGTGLSAYRPATLGAYTNSTSRTFNQLKAPEWGARNSARSAPMGGANIVATRFRRFQ